MKQQTPEQNLKIIKKLYEALGREFPDESRTVIDSFRICVELTGSGRLDVQLEERFFPIVDDGN